MRFIMNIVTAMPDFKWKHDTLVLLLVELAR
jgi:hypothetical protein